jgi:hypothetical protein
MDYVQQAGLRLSLYQVCRAKRSKRLRAGNQLHGRRRTIILEIHLAILILYLSNFAIPPPPILASRSCVYSCVYRCRVFELAALVMFSADLSWTDPDAEKVGERRQRIAREREWEHWSPSVASSNHSGKTPRTSIQDDREIWWPSSLKKARSKKPAIKSGPDTSHSKHHARSGSTQPVEISSIPLPKTHEIDTSDTIRDPSKQPSCVYSGTLSQPLPSGAPLDPPENEIPELEGDLSSRRTGSTGSGSSRKQHNATLTTRVTYCDYR